MGYYATQGFAACKLPLRNGPDQGTDGFAENLTLVEGARDAVGTDVDLMTDIYLRWDVDYTLRFAEAAPQLDIKWIEEPIALDDYEGMGRLVRMLDTTWIVSGEHEFTRYGFRELLRWNAADMIQPDVSWAGGFGECIKIANEAASQGIPTWPHQGWNALGVTPNRLPTDAVHGRNLRPLTSCTRKSTLPAPTPNPTRWLFHPG